MLLHVVRAPTSFDSLETVNGHLYPSFRAACQKRGLLEDDQHWDQTLAHEQLTSSPTTICNLFAIIITSCNPSEPLYLWEKYKDAMSDDILHKLRRGLSMPELTFSADICNEALILLEEICLQIHSKTLDAWGLPSPRRNRGDPLDANYIRELNYDPNVLRSNIDHVKPLLNSD